MESGREHGDGFRSEKELNAREKALMRRFTSSFHTVATPPADTMSPSDSLTGMKEGGSVVKDLMDFGSSVPVKRRKVAARFRRK